MLFLQILYLILYNWHLVQSCHSDKNHQSTIFKLKSVLLVSFYWLYVNKLVVDSMIKKKIQLSFFYTNSYVSFIGFFFYRYFSFLRFLDIFCVFYTIRWYNMLSYLTGYSYCYILGYTTKMCISGNFEIWKLCN